jgi:hypothetical protein
MRTNIITSTITSVFGTRQDRIVTAGSDRCALAHARLLPAWHMHVALVCQSPLAWVSQYVEALKRDGKQTLAAAVRLWAASDRPANGSRSIESVTVRSVPRVSVPRG